MATLGCNRRLGMFAQGEIVDGLSPYSPYWEEHGKGMLMVWGCVLSAQWSS